MALSLKNLGQRLLDSTTIDEKISDFFRPKTGKLATAGRNWAQELAVKPAPSWVPQQVQRTAQNISDRGGLSRVGQQIKSNPQQFNIFSSALTGKSQAPEPIKQMAGQGFESASFGLLKNRVPEPTTTAGKVGKFAGGVVGSIPAFTAGTSLLGGTTRNIGNLGRLGRTAMDLGVGATSMALTTPGNPKQRLQTFKQNLTDPLQIAMSLALPFGANAVTQQEKKVAARKVGEALKKELSTFDIPKIDLTEKPKWNMRVKSVYKELDEPLFDLKGSSKITPQEAKIVGRIKQEVDKAGEVNKADIKDIYTMFKNKIKGVNADRMTPEAMTEELWQHSKNMQINYASDIPTPKLSVESTAPTDLLSEARKYGSAEEFANKKAPLPGTSSERQILENIDKAKANIEIYKQRGDTKGVADETSYINKRLEILDKRKQLTDIYNQAKDAQGGLGNISKYKNVDDFIKAQGKPIYHGTDVDFNEFSLKDFGKTDEGFLGKGVYLTSQKSNAKQYGENIVESYTNLKNPYEYSDSYFFGGFSPSKLKKQLELPDSSSSTQVRNKLIEMGHDGVVINEITDTGVIKGAEVVVFDPKNIKTKSQLTDIYNQAKDAQGGLGDIKPAPQTQLSSKIETPQITKTPQTPVLSTKPSGIKTSSPDILPRGLSTSVQEAPNVIKDVKTKVGGNYTVKPNTKLMGEAQALLQSGASIDFKNTKNLDQKVAATIQEAINLQKTDPQAAANLFNNLSEHATELGRGVQAFSLLQKMTPESIALSAAGKIKKYNMTATRKIPELTGEQTKMIADQVAKVDGLVGREKNIAINELSDIVNSFIPSSKTDKFLTVWKAGLLTSLRTHERNLVGNSIMGGSEVVKDVLATPFDALMSLKTGKRTLTPTSSTGTGWQKGLQSAKDIVQTGFDPEDAISKYEVKKINWGDNPVEQGLKKYTDFVFRTLGGEDKPFWQSSYARSLYDQAGAEAINVGKQGDKAFIQSLVDNPTEQMLVNATKDANYTTFHDQNKLSELAGQFKRWAGKEWYTKLPAEIFAPFTGVPSSIVGKTIDYSPIGLVKGVVNTGRVLTGQVPELQRQAAQEIGRGVMGTGLFGLGAYLMGKGLMTGQPKDAKESDQWKLEGKQSNSVLINGQWRSINSIGPQNLVMLAGAKYQEEMGPQGNGGGAYLGGLAKDQLSQTFLQGVQGPLNAINDPARYGKSYVGNTAASIIPNILKDTSKAFDSTQRETNTVGDYMKLGTPGLRNTLTPKRDVLGNAMAQEPTGLNAYTDLFNSKTSIHNTVVDELARLNSVGSEATPSKINKNQTILKNKVVLTPEQLDSFEAGAGKEVQASLAKLITSKGYQSLSDEKKAKAISDTVSSTRSLYKAIHGKDLLSNASLANPTYTQSKDSPTGIDRIGLYLKASVNDPITTIKAVTSGQPIRKISGKTVILERQNSLGGLDAGDTETQVDHKIALALGGTNDPSNLQILSATDNAAKGKFETYLAKQLVAGNITKKQAQEMDLNWREEIGQLPASEQSKIVQVVKKEAPVVDPSKQYQIIDETTGNVKEINLTPVPLPEYTGSEVIDKKLKSSYKSALTRQTNDVIALYQDGQITLDEAKSMIAEITKKKDATGSGSTKSKKKITIKQTKSKPVTFKLSKTPQVAITAPKVNRTRPTLKGYKVPTIRV